MSEETISDVAAYKKSSRLGPLDSLRGIAACGIAFVYHWVWLFGAADSSRLVNAPGSSIFVFHWLYNYGELFVELFFVISGFIFVHTYYDKVTTGLVSAREFFLRRVARLLPLMVFSSTLLFGIQIIRLLFGKGLFFTGVSVTVSDYIFSLFFLQAAILSPGLALNGPAWSLSCEVLMYGVFFFLALKSKHRTKYFLLGCAALLLCGVGISRLNFELLFLNSMVARALVGFFSGALFYFLNKKIASLNKSRSRYWNLNLQFVILLALVLVALLGVQFGSEFLGSNTVTYCVFIFPAVIFLALNSKPLSWFLNLRLFRFLGEISYSIYLMNFPLIALFVSLTSLMNLNPDFYSKKVLLVFVVFSVSLSYLTYRLFEKPANRLLRSKFRV
jgi:peptidoglycan/LPS O-acetylase OafA/YrhL